MENRVKIGGFFSEAIQMGLKNALPIIVNSLLFVLTCWIPYLNLGTIIGMSKLVIKIARGEAIGMTEIFDKKNREQIGDFFMTFGLLTVGSLGGLNFILAIAWSQSILFTLDKEMGPLEAIRASYKATYGSKMPMFFGLLILGLALSIVSGILAAIPAIGYILAAIISIAASCIMVGAQAYIYKTVSNNV